MISRKYHGLLVALSHQAQWRGRALAAAGHKGAYQTKNKGFCEDHVRIMRVVQLERSTVW